MSAFMVGPTHIDALLTAGMHRAYTNYGPLGYVATEPNYSHNNGRVELTRETADRMGAMLLGENQRSVNHRYSEDEIEEVYTFRRMEGYPHPLVILRAISCYEYQACEHPEWETSEAYRFCEALRYAALSILTRDVDTWEIGNRDEFLNFAAVQKIKEGAGA